MTLKTICVAICGFLFAMTQNFYAMATEQTSPPSKAEKAEEEEMGTFAKMNFMRKMMGIGMSASSHQKDAEEAEKKITDAFSEEKVDEGLVEKAKVDYREGVAGSAKALEEMMVVMSESVPASALDKMNAEFSSQGKGQEEAEKGGSEAMIPASFSADQIAKIRTLKAKNKAAREANRAGIEKLKDSKAFTQMMQTARKTGQKISFADLPVMASKNLDIDIAEYREMRTYLSPEQMRTYFTLQEQIKEKKVKEAKEKAAARKAEVEAQAKEAKK